MKRAIIDSTLLFLVAALFILPLFQIEYFDNWMSIDGAFIGDARFLSDHLPNAGWVPYFYCGNRVDYLYPPAMRYSTALLARYGGLSVPRAYHVYSALLYCLFLAGVYALVRVGAGSRGWGVAAALASLILSPVLLLIQEIRDDSMLHMPQRLNVIVKWGEVPHMSSLGVLLFALAAGWLALRGRQPALMALTALLSAVCVSNNFYGATALAVFFLFMVWALWVTHGGASIWWRAAVIAVLSYGLTAFWLTPSYLSLTAANLKLVAEPGDARSRLLAGAALAVFGYVSYRIGRQKPERAWPIFLSGGLCLFGLSGLGTYYFDFHALGDPVRLIPEFDLLLILAAIECLRRRAFLPRAAGGALLAASFVMAVPYLRSPWRVYVPDPHPEQRIEYRLSGWLAKNLPGARVHSAGSVGFWSYVWNDVSQVGGISDQGMQNQIIALANWQILKGDQAVRAIYWLQALGADAVVVHGKRSKEIYHAHQIEDKFRGRLNVLFDSGEDDIVYRVPRRFPGLARVVERRKMEALPEIAWNNDNEFQLRAYVEALEQGPDSPASSEWLNSRIMRIRSRIRDGESVAVQVSYDPWWRAYSGGSNLPIHKDVMGFLRIDPPAGEHEIYLKFETPLENTVGRVISIITAIIVLLMLATGATSRTVPSPRPAAPWAAKGLG